MTGLEFAWFVVGLVVGVLAMVPAFIMHLTACENWKRRSK